MHSPSKKNQYFYNFLPFVLQKWTFSCILSHCGTNPGFFQKLHYHFSYINDVEVFAPGYSCSYKMLTPYPHKVKGTVSGFLMGSAIVCGGGEMIYVDCTKHNEGSKQCDRNYECVETTGGSQWCTGPKTDLCYAYDSISKVASYLFSKVFPCGEKQRIPETLFSTILYVLVQKVT